MTLIKTLRYRSGFWEGMSQELLEVRRQEELLEFPLEKFVNAQAPQAHNAIIYHLVREFNGEKS